MESITQNYEKILENLIINNFSDILNGKTLVNPGENQVFNYIRILDTLDERICDIARKSLETMFSSIDRGYKNSPERRHKYHIKAHTTRTIMTIFGEITYKKTIYQDKHNYKTYCYIDDYLGLKKYDYFDPYIKGCVLKYAADNPCTKVAKIINDMIGKRVHLDEPFQYISKQTIRNIILTSVLSKPELNELETPDDLYVMADEKFIATQNNNKEDVMIKEIVVFDGRTINNKRATLKNKITFASFKNNCIDECLDYLYYTYDFDKVKNIFIMGDGACWIKNLRQHFKINTNTNVSFNLDKFHFKQAIHHIAQNENIEHYLTDYVIHNMKDEFIYCCDSLSKSFPYRSETIYNKKDYIINNWKYINNLYKNKLKCPMESQISHSLADLLSSRPKAYSLKTLDKLLLLRLLFKNKHNIISLFLNNFNKKEVLTFNQEPLNYSIFDIDDSSNFDTSIIPDNYRPGHYTDSSYNLTYSSKYSNFLF